jgi:hypothetical protein
MADEVRKIILESLKSKNWFKKTEKGLRDEVLGLPEDFDGFLKDLGERPEEIGNVRVNKLLKLERGNYLITPVFEVESRQTLEKYTYEYVSWKYGRDTGSRGIIFLTENGRPKYFIVRRSQRFPLGKEIYDAIGSFYPKFGDDKYIDLPVKIEKQIRTIIGIDDLMFDRIVDLGVLSPDSGQGNQLVALFALYIDVTNNEGEILKAIKGKTFGAERGRFEVEVFPISELMGFVTRTPDAYILSIISRCLSLNLITK